MSRIFRLTNARVALLLLLLALAPQTAIQASGVVGTGTPGSCTEAAFDSALAGGGAVTFNCGGAATITLTALKEIADNTTIDGGRLITLSGSTTYLFQVFFGKSLTLQAVTLANGSSNIAGAIENFGTTTVMNSQLTNNRSSGNGGAIVNHGTLNVTNSALTNNQAANLGGAIYNDGGSITMQSTTLDNNIATGNGGGIYSIANVTLTNVTLSSNRALSGGGGGIYQGAGIASLGFVTIAGNVGLFGGGVYQDGGSGGNMYLQNTVLSNNAGGDCDGTPSSLGNNLSSDTHCAAFTQSGDLKNTPALLGPLANNGGSTLTHMLLAGSPAINGGVCVVGVTTDQRGVARPQGPACDIGAVEKKAGDKGFFLYLPLTAK